MKLGGKELYISGLKHARKLKFDMLLPQGIDNNYQYYHA